MSKRAAQTAAVKSPMSGFFEQEQLRMFDTRLMDVEAASRATFRAPTLLSGSEVARARLSLLVL